MTDRILIIGGGVRMDEAAKAFVNKGYNVTVFDGSTPLKSAIEQSKIILLGIPASTDDIHVNTENTLDISLRDVAMLAGKNKIVLGGRLSERVKALFDVYYVKWADYADNEEFEILNAVPTAEGAIQIAMEEFPFTIHSSRVIVTGFGKVAKALCQRLKALGASVCVCARKKEDRAEAETLGYSSISFTLLPKYVSDCDILFNTVPAKVIEKNVLSNMTQSQGIIDLASKPGGIALDYARSVGLNVIWALGLPGKVAPVSAGEIIQKTVCNIVEDIRL
ncbi:MAG: dipicolinate synthase subunit DpsA [Clostridia bacterium]